MTATGNAGRRRVARQLLVVAVIAGVAAACVGWILSDEPTRPGVAAIDADHVHDPMDGEAMGPMAGMDGGDGHHPTTTTSTDSTAGGSRTRFTEAEIDAMFPPVPAPEAARRIDPSCTAEIADMEMDMGMGGTSTHPATTTREADGSYERTYLGRHARIDTSNVPFGSAPTKAQAAAADRLVAQVRQVVADRGWADPAQAVRDGFRPMQGCSSHFVDVANALDGRMLDPARPEYLVYAPQPDGTNVLEAVMFMADGTAHGPQPFGPVAAWHYHRQETCTAGTVVVPARGQGCPAGTTRSHRSPEMLHVNVTGPAFSGTM